MIKLVIGENTISKISDICLLPRHFSSVNSLMTTLILANLPAFKNLSISDEVMGDVKGYKYELYNQITGIRLINFLHNYALAKSF